ncbi:MAG: peroxiredoxin family protein [bacterium]
MLLFNFSKAGIFLIGFCAFAFAAQAKSLSMQKIKVFESTTKTWHESTALIGSQEVFLPMTLLATEFGLTRKNLTDDKLGICLNEICIPFSKNTGETSIQFQHGQEYVPARHLVKALNGHIVWDAEQAELLLSLRPYQSESGQLNTAVSDFTLPDMQDNPVAISDFKGKKVIVFAWASW